MGRRIKIEYGTKIGEWEVHEYMGQGMYYCTCSCGSIKLVSAKSLKNGTSKSCGHSKNTKIDLTDKVFGEWKVIKESDIKGKWICQCSCGNTKIIDGHELRRGNTKSCGHSRVIGDLTDQTFGEWKVLCKSDKKRYWKCQCSCGEIRDILDYSLLHGDSTSCGHKITKYSDYNPGDKFGELTLVKQVNKQMFEFKCSCGNTRIYNINSVVKNSNNTRSCGCKSAKLRMNTLIINNGDFKTQGEKREAWQIEVLSSQEKFIEYLSSLDNKTSRNYVAKQLGVTRTGLYEAAKRYDINLYDYIDARNKTGSPEETEVLQYIKSIYTGNIICNTRKLIPPKEIDIYIPEKKLAVEFNGDYWHSDIHKNKYYHQQKTVECAKQGVHLIHIFEYEWNNSETMEKLKKILNRELNSNTNVIAGRKTTIHIINNSESKDFCNKYHLQGHINAKIHLGCFFNNELVGIMTFSKPRFNKEYEYEIARLCWKDNTTVIGGANKLLKYFVQHFSPTSILTYSDISKFTGNIYTKLGFKVIEITKPNYVWVNFINGDVVSRYQAQKHKLIELGLADNNDTEKIAMERMGYHRIYDSGNIKLGWVNE